MIIGHGAEETWLRENLAKADLPGVLRGEDLSRAYANMDLFVFPSHTDTFGNVVQEAAASGVPSIVTADGGPQNLVVPNVTGFVCQTDAAFLQKVVLLASEPELRRKLAAAARERILGASWDAAFEMTYSAYRFCQHHQEVGGPAGGAGLFLRPHIPSA